MLARDRELGVPYVVSENCLVTGNYSSDGEATLHVLNTILLVDSHGSIQRAFPEANIVDNARSDLPLPSSDSEVYYFRTTIDITQNELGAIYRPRTIIELTKLDLDFEEFLQLSREDRGRLLIRYRVD